MTEKFSILRDLRMSSSSQTRKSLREEDELQGRGTTSFWNSLNKFYLGLVAVLVLLILILLWLCVGPSG
jgi:flagellar biosynthesis/type III secretory pathway M-ring protein FliF/YscJ